MTMPISPACLSASPASFSKVTPAFCCDRRRYMTTKTARHKLQVGLGWTEVLCILTNALQRNIITKDAWHNAHPADLPLQRGWFSDFNETSCARKDHPCCCSHQASFLELERCVPEISESCPPLPSTLNACSYLNLLAAPSPWESHSPPKWMANKRATVTSVWRVN